MLQWQAPCERIWNQAGTWLLSVRGYALYGATVLGLASLTTIGSVAIFSDQLLLVADPVVEVVATQEATKHVARFAPRVRLSSDLKYSHVFSLRNNGRQDLIVKQKSKSCDCLSAEVDREMIKPGEAAAVTLEVKPNNLVNKQATVTIQTDDGASHVYQLQTWTYLPVMLDSGRDLPISFGQLAPGTPMTGKHRLTVHSTAETPPPELKWFPVPGSEEITCILTERGVESFAEGRLQRREYDLEVAVAAGTAPGLVSKEISFAPAADGGEAYHFSTRVTWVVGSPISVDPPRWILKKDELQSTVPLRRKFALVDRQGRAIRVLSVECSEPSLTVQSIAGASESQPEYEVTLDPTKLTDEKAFVGTVKLQIALADADPPVSVSESFKVIAPPRGGSLGDR